MDIAIEPARDEHIPRLVEIYSGQELHRHEDQARRYVQSHFDYNHIVIATVDDKVQGACFWRIEDLFVEKDYRNLGLGEMLVKRPISDLLHRRWSMHDAHLDIGRRCVRLYR